MNETTNEAPVAFETALKDLESIVARLETGELGIDQAIEQFEAGLALLKTCRARLEHAELRVRELLAEEPLGPPA